jgi:predicted ATPase
VEIELAPLVVLMGPNAAGKSNLLEALLLLSRLANEQTLAGAFEPPLRGYPLEAFGLPDDGLQGLLKKDSAELTLEATVEPRQAAGRAASDLLRYQIAIRIQPKTGALIVSDEYLAHVGRDGTIKQKPLPRIEREGNKLVVRRPGEAPRHEELGLNHTLLSNRKLTGDRRYPDFDRLRRELSAWQTYYLDPRIAMREPQPPREVTDIGPRGEWIAPFLFRLKGSEPMRKHFQGIGRALRAAIPTIESLDVDLDPRRGTLDILIRQDGTPFSSRVVSEGTLRVLALCCLAGNPWPGELIAFEEPETGVHPRRIEVVADLLVSMADADHSQVVVTTHSPTLIAEMLQRAREMPGKIKIFRCFQHGKETGVAEFHASGPLFEDESIRLALTGADDAGFVEAMLVRGWLDG